MLLIGLLASMEKMVPEGCLHMRPFQFHLKEHCRYPQSLDNLLPWLETINWSGLTAYAYPPTALLHRVIQKIIQCNCLIILIVPGCPGMPWFWDQVQLSTEIPLQLPVSTTLLKHSQVLSHNQIFHNNPQHLNPHACCLGVDRPKNKASLENCCPSKAINKDHLPIKVGPI